MEVMGLLDHEDLLDLLDLRVKVEQPEHKERLDLKEFLENTQDKV